MAANAGAIRAGRAFVELLADDRPLNAALNAAVQRVGRFVGRLTGIGAEAGGTVFDAARRLFTGFVERGAMVDRVANAFGTTTENVSELAFAFERVGLGAGQFEGFMQGFAARIKSAADNNSELIDGLRGLRGRFLLGYDVGTQLDMVAEKFKTIKKAEDQIAVANELGLGAMLPYLKKGKAGLDELRQAAREAGATISKDEASRSAQAMREYTATWQALKYSIMEVGRQLLPSAEAIKSTGQAARGAIFAFRDWAKEILSTGGILKDMFAIFNETWSGIMTAVEKGDMQLAWKIAYAGIKAGWFTMLDDMSAALSEWIKSNRDKIILIGAALGGIKGGMMGSRFGPFGTVIGGAIGAGGAGWVAGDVADMLASRGAFMRRAQDARAELDKLVAQARAAKGGGGGGGGGAKPWSFFGIPGDFIQMMQRSEHAKVLAAMANAPTLFDRVKGSFNLTSARGQFGYGDTMGKRQLDALNGINKNAAVLPDIKRELAEFGSLFTFK